MIINISLGLRSTISIFGGVIMSVEEIRGELKKFRMKMAPSAPYQVFNDAVLEDLLAARPKNLEALSRVRGFPRDGKRIEKYGSAIIAFFKNGCKVDEMGAF
jgi:superfamily II DNA helicase RecQ